MLLTEFVGVQHVDFEFVGVVIYTACLLWRRSHSKLVVNWVPEVPADGGGEVIPIKKLYVFGETDVPVVRYP